MSERSLLVREATLLLRQAIGEFKEECNCTTYSCEFVKSGPVNVRPIKCQRSQHLWRNGRRFIMRIAETREEIELQFDSNIRLVNNGRFHVGLQQAFERVRNRMWMAKLDLINHCLEYQQRELAELVCDYAGR